jgi:hypothetical protein
MILVGDYYCHIKIATQPRVEWNGFAKGVRGAILEIGYEKRMFRVKKAVRLMFSLGHSNR